MKSLNKYIIVVAIIFAVLLANELSKPKPINWRKTYSQNDKIPFGGYVIYDQLKKLNDGFPLETIDKSPYEYIDNVDEIVKDNPSNLIIIQSDGFIDLYEWDKIKDYTKKGNSVFIATSYLGSDIEEDLEIEIRGISGVLSNDTVVRGRLLDNVFNKKANYVSNFVNEIRYFDFDKESYKINTLGVINGFYPDFIEYAVGEGKIYLHANPTVFSNIHILNKNNYQYTFSALSYLPQQATIWDEFYKKSSVETEQTHTPLAFLLSQPALKWSLYCLLAGAVLFFIFRAKRRQRIIPVVTPLANTSLEFTETIGRLYFNRGNHHDIALKKIQYFNQYIFSKYNLRFDGKNPDYILHLAEKSGVSENYIQDIIKRINSVKNNKGIKPNELLELNKIIDRFYNTAK